MRCRVRSRIQPLVSVQFSPGGEAESIFMEEPKFSYSSFMRTFARLSDLESISQNRLLWMNATMFSIDKILQDQLDVPAHLADSYNALDEDYHALKTIQTEILRSKNFFKRRNKAAGLEKSTHKLQAQIKALSISATEIHPTLKRSQLGTWLQNGSASGQPPPMYNTKPEASWPRTPEFRGRTNDIELSTLAANPPVASHGSSGPS